MWTILTFPGPRFAHSRKPRASKERETGSKLGARKMRKRRGEGQSSCHTSASVSHLANGVRSSIAKVMFKL